MDVDLTVGLHEVLASEDLRGWLSGVDEQTPGPRSVRRLRGGCPTGMSRPLVLQQPDGVGRGSVRTVVGAAIVRERRVLAARRRTPANLAGLWEFPGGKVEPGESESAAVVRECREELGISVVVEGQLGRAPIGENMELVLYAATLTKGQPTSSATHDLLRWLAMDELATVQWLEPDNKLLNAVEQHVSRRPPRDR